MGLEIERKYVHVALPTLRQHLLQCGAHCLGAHFESNWVFDAEGVLLASDRLLRLRTQEWPGRTRHVLTLKLPTASLTGFKVREERETLVPDAAAMRSLLNGLGYAVTARYEKVREPWHLDAVDVALDVLPFGDMVELEGPEEALLLVERNLGLDKAETSTKTYHELHQDWLRQQGRPPQLSFVFAAAQRAVWRAKLGLPSALENA